MKVLLTGAAGRLGQALRSSRPAGLELIATCRDELDLSEAAACRAAVERHRPDWVLNAGAYTAVDKAEAEPDLANAVNGEAPRACRSDPEGGRSVAATEHRLRLQWPPGALPGGAAP